MSLKLFDYDDTSLESVLEYSKQLGEYTMREIVEEYQKMPYKTYEDFKNKKITITDDRKIDVKSKGRYGNNIEEYFYGYKTNSDSSPDFKNIDVELKVTPYKVNNNNTISAKERLVLTILNYLEENLDDFKLTHLWRKCQKILLLFYNGKKGETDYSEYKIDKQHLFTWFKEDMPVILEDYKRISQKIKNGKAHELSESDGNYLSTCTKGRGKENDYRPQPYSDIKAKQRAWVLKSSYMTYLIRNKIFSDENIESIVKEKNSKRLFTYIISEKIMKYQGKSQDDLYQIFDVKKSKSKNNQLIRNILELKGDLENTQEFQKANINLRVIRVNKDYLPKEDSPFKNYNFIELSENLDWENSHPFLEIYSKRYLFVIFKENDKKEFILDSIKFWGFPERLEDELKRVWLETVDIIKKGVDLKIKNDKVITNFPTSLKNKYIFTKIHANNILYEIEKGKFYGKGKESRDTDVLPDGRKITKHSFWFTKKFIREILKGNWE